MSVTTEHVFVSVFSEMFLTSSSAPHEGVFGEKIKLCQVTAVFLFETPV